MTEAVTIGPHVFDRVSYDAEADVLYLSIGQSRAAAVTHATPEGHAARFDASDQLIGLTLVNVKWLLEREGGLAITLPVLSRVDASTLEPALHAA